MINNLAGRVKVHYTKASISTINSRDLKDADIGPIQQILSYVNYLPIPITVVDRAGFRHIVPSVHNSLEEQFIIRLEIRVRHDCVGELRKLLSCTNTVANHELNLLKTIFLEKQEQRYHNGFVVNLDYKVDLDTLKINGGNLYVKSRDIVVSTLDLKSAPSHPFAEDTICDNVILGSDNLDHDLGSPSFKIEIIDNNDDIGSRFVFALGEIHQIKPKTDLKRHSGVYVTTIEPNIINDLGYSLTQKRFTSQEAEEQLGVFKTRDLAKSAGDLKEVRKEEIIRLEHSNSLLKHEVATQKQKFDSEMQMLQHQKNMDELQHQVLINKLEREKDQIEHVRELERSERKDYYDKVSQTRKDTSEIIKFLPHVIIGIGALIVAVRKMQK